MTKCRFRISLVTAVGLATVPLLGTTCFAASNNSPRRPPNFVFILGEGHGWASLSVPMDDAEPNSKSSVVRTPNFEKLAQTGMRFANFYASSPRCTPSRAALFTGKSPAQLHMTFVKEGKRETGEMANSRVLPPRSSNELPTRELTIAGLLKSGGYATAHFGKWHVGRIHPREYGFDESDGATNNGGPDNEENPHPKQLFGMTERGLDFMTRQVQAGKPFYLQLSHYASRQGGDARPESVAAVKNWGGNLSERELATAAADGDLDVAFGMVLQKLDELKIADSTYVIFTTDHGTPGKNPPFSGGKGTIWEGGLRVPLIVRGPGVKPGACCHVRTVGVDLFPTIAQLAHVTAPQRAGLEGGSLVPLLLGGGSGDVQRPREDYVVHFPHYDKDSIGPASSILWGDYKLIRVYETDQRLLFNLAQDPGERRDLAGQMPDKVQELDSRLTQYLDSVHAQLPSVNANFVPGADDQAKPKAEPRPGGKGGQGGKRRKQP